MVSSSELLLNELVVFTNWKKKSLLVSKLAGSNTHQPVDTIIIVIDNIFISFILIQSTRLINIIVINRRLGIIMIYPVRLSSSTNACIIDKASPGYGVTN